MIELTHVTKSFARTPAVSDVSLTIREAGIFGLIGTNGAGKSTLLRLMAGVLRPDTGEITMDGAAIYNNPETKARLFFIPDNPWFFPNGTAEDMKTYYASVYPSFDAHRFDQLLEAFGLDGQRRTRTYSKGMRKQLAVICGLASRPDYLLCDETFDGLDPVMRQAVKSLFAEDIDKYGLAPVIASHNLRELEDVCDHVGLLHRGGILLSEDLESMKLGIYKIQCVFRHEAESDDVLASLDLVRHEQRGRLHTMVVRADTAQIKAAFTQTEMTFFEVLPLTLEEIFISETEVVGYDIKALILD